MKRRILLLTPLVLLLTVCVSIGLVMRGYWREQASRELILAINANDTNRALDALRAHADPNARDLGNVRPSLRAYLVQLWQQMRGIKPSALNEGHTALALAVSQNNTVLVEALLARGVRDTGETLLREAPYPEGEQFLSLLMVAAQNKNPAIVRALVKQGWKVNAVNKNLETALFYAEDAATVKALVTCGASIDAEDHRGLTVLDSAMYYRPRDVADALLDQGAHGTQALTLAVQMHRIEMLNKMFALGQKSDVPDGEGCTPLMAALQSANTVYPDEAWLLLQRGANVNARDNEGETPLLLAADGGNAEPMMSKSPGIVEALLDRGAQVDVQDKRGWTPLMVACYAQCPILVRLLLQHGARVNIHTPQGKTALSMARHHAYRGPDNGNQSAIIIIRLLQQAGAKE